MKIRTLKFINGKPVKKEREITPVPIDNYLNLIKEVKNNGTK